MSEFILAPKLPARVSWWAGAPRDGFSARARQEQPRMMLSQAGERKRPCAPELRDVARVLPKWGQKR